MTIYIMGKAVPEQQVKEVLKRQYAPAPEVRESRREYSKRPEVRESRREYMREYRAKARAA